MEVKDEEFERDMEEFADGAKADPTYRGSYSREDIYFDHD